MVRQQSTAIEISAPGLAREIERVLVLGDLSRLTEEQCVDYYLATCKSLGLNPLTKPFSYLILNGKKVLYANKDCTEQLRKIHGISVTDLVESMHEGVFIVKAKGSDKTGRTDASTGAVNVAGLRGDALANAMMKAETKSKRRFTLSICGLGMLDETEIETIPGARIEDAKVETNVQPLLSKEDRPRDDSAEGDKQPVSTGTAKPAAAQATARPAQQATAKPAAQQAKPAAAAKPAQAASAAQTARPAQAAPTAATPAEDPKPAAKKPKSRSDRAREIAKVANCNSTLIIQFICAHLGCDNENINQVPTARIDATISALETCLKRFPASAVGNLIRNDDHAMPEVKQHFLETFANLTKE